MNLEETSNDSTVSKGSNTNFPEVKTAIIMTPVHGSFTYFYPQDDNISKITYDEDRIYKHFREELNKSGIPYFKLDCEKFWGETTFILLNIDVDYARKLAYLFGQRSFLHLEFGKKRIKGGGYSDHRFTAYTKPSIDSSYIKSENITDIFESQDCHESTEKKLDIVFSAIEVEIKNFYSQFSDEDLKRLKYFYSQFKTVTGGKNKWILSRNIYSLYDKYLDKKNSK